MAYYEFVGKDASSKSEKSEKFWEITQVENKVTVRFGKIGVNGQTKDKEHPTKEDADKEVARLSAEKTKTGYIEKPKP